MNRFLRYVKIDTQSDEDSKTIPSSPKEVAFLRDLSMELETLGLENVRTMPDGY